MTDLTWFGWVYIVGNGLGAVYLIASVGEVIERTAAGVTASIGIWLLTLWGLLSVGLVTA